MQNIICKALDIKVPIIQGPMAWISTAPLVAAVSNAGGLGVLGVGFGSLEFAEQQILETKKLTNKPFAINTILLPELLPAITQLIEKTKVPIIYADTLGHLDEDLCTNYFEKWHKMGATAAVLVKELAGNSLKVAMSEGDIDNGAIMIGQIVPLVKEEKTAASIIMDTISEAKQIIDSLTSYDFN